MHCRNCNSEIPDGANTCPACGVSREDTEKRCPDCWTKLTENDKICPKCGINIEEAQKARYNIANTKKVSFWEVIKNLPPKLKITILSVVGVLLASVIVFNIAAEQSAKSGAVKLAGEYLVMAEETMEDITDLALEYENKVYNKDWIMHIESAQELRETNADAIKEIKAKREPMEYFQARIRKTEQKDIVKSADAVFYAYKNCYAYVVGEVGKYPHYYDNYKKLLKEYQKAITELKKAMEK